MFSALLFSAKNTVRTAKYSFQAYDSYVPVLFSESKTHCATSDV